ncbi:DNA-directed RNA polymerase III subunit RPC3 [Morus notabilis]|uniref:DNA-directed RNA polymerase III subunit RPC3 n=1 Tax=Morus notabilis TaxID=981085 RepID=W9RZG4_9ROSA|nr:DNA-directed RNA polymerase III subunit RPC3 [Morus notabilis]
MATPYGIKFAVHLITSHFGNLVANVCENLLRKGPLTLQQLIRFTELTPLQIKNSLLILIQHNCVQPFSSEQIGAGGNEVKVTQYLVLFDNILHRLRFPKFLEIVSEELDKNCGEILEGLLQHGRLTLEQIYERARDNAVQDAVRESFQKLLNSRFVERCPAPEPFVEPSTIKSSNKRGAKSAKLDEVSETEEQRVLAAAASLDTLRFSILTPSGTEFDEDKKDGDSSSSMGVGEKRKHGAADSDDAFGSNENEVILWRANFEEFTRYLRHKACIENVRARLDVGAATVLKAMLDATRSAEKKVKTENSVSLSMDTIFEEVMKSEAGRSLTLDRVRASLVQLGCSSSGTDDTYSIDLKQIIELAQKEEVESIVLRRYGRDAYRMFRLLSKAGLLQETDKIADMTFVEKKEAPKILGKLWKDEYLHMEVEYFNLLIKFTLSSNMAICDVVDKPRLTLSGMSDLVLMDQNKEIVNKFVVDRNTTFYLWKVNKPILWQHVLDEMYHAALNLSLRVIHELDQKKELLTIPPEKRTGPLEKEFKRLKNAKFFLESSLMKLDDALMLFRHF